MKKSFICYQIEYALFHNVDFVSDESAYLNAGESFNTIKTHGDATLKQKLKNKGGNKYIIQTIDKVYCQFETKEELNNLLADDVILRIKSDTGDTHIIGTHEYPVKVSIDKNLNVAQLKFECQRPYFSI
ncbi:MAG: hypothetical protein JEY96_01590 [Bacteroidales bacterium]|nr:hypothetical protein [Bacteroidales bacterium]